MPWGGEGEKVQGRTCAGGGAVAALKVQSGQVLHMLRHPDLIEEEHYTEEEQQVQDL